LSRTTSAPAFAQGKRVLVTGAGGRTGSIVVEKLVSSGRYDVRALVTSESSKKALLNKVEMLNPKAVFVGDIQQPGTLADAFKGIFALVCVTSAVPKLKIWSIFPVIFGKLFRRQTKPKFGWRGGKPEQVDWEGQRNQFDCAKDANAKKVVLVGTMTGTEKDSFLNSIGEGDGDQIVMWKRKAEVYLMDLCKKSDIAYTIVHAGGLGDAPGGQDLVEVGVDDKIREDPKNNRRISRADVAEVCVRALACDEAANRSFDLTGVAAGGVRLSDVQLPELLDRLKGSNCDYSINPPP